MKLGIVMDPINRINIKKDSSFAMLLAAQSRSWDIYYMEMQDLFLEGDNPMARIRSIQVQDDSDSWYQLGEPMFEELRALDVILMRKDPPFDLNYIYATYLLEHAERKGVKVVNKPAAIRNANEKILITRFSQCIAPTLISRDLLILSEFVKQKKKTIIKPLDGMGGRGIYQVIETDPNKQAILEAASNNGTEYVMLQEYIPEIASGDKRILMIDGAPIPYALARIPADGELRGNLVRGGTGKGVRLSERDQWICARVGPFLKEQGLLFVGLDVIGNYLTEINVTSPTCVQELQNLYDIDIAGQFLDVLTNQVQH